MPYINCRECKYYLDTNDIWFCLMAIGNGYIGIEKMKNGLAGKCVDYELYKKQ